MFELIKEYLLEVRDKDNNKILKKIWNSLGKERPFWILTVLGAEDENFGSDNCYMRTTELELETYFNEIEQDKILMIANAFLSIKGEDLIDETETYIGQLYVNSYNVDYREEEGKNVVIGFNIEVVYEVV